MAETPPQPAVDELVQQLKADQALVREATQAINQAAEKAQEIVAAIPETPQAVPNEAAPEVPSPAASTDAAPDTLVPEIEWTSELGRLLAIEVPVIVQLSARRMTVGEVMRFSVGAIIEFEKSADEELELLVNNKKIGQGQAVKVGENFGIRISGISPVKETIRKLGGL